MFVEPAAQAELGQVFAIIRDGAFVFGIIMVGWKTRNLLQPLFEFFKGAKQHMRNVEETLGRMDKNMSEMMSNHIVHIEHDLRMLSGRRTRTISNEDMDPEPGDDTEV